MRYKITGLNQNLLDRSLNINNDTDMRFFDLELRGVYPDCNWCYSCQKDELILDKEFSEYPQILERYGVLEEVNDDI